MRSLIESVFADGKKMYACFNIDFKKAFDSVIHNGIKYKMLNLGIGGKFYDIVKNMYNTSVTSVRVGNNLTNSFNIKLDVRQSGNLSPNLFKIFINDRPSYFDDDPHDIKWDNIRIHCLMYA